MLALQALPLGALLQLGAAWATNDAGQALLPTWALLFVLIEAFYLARWLARHQALKRWTAVCIGVGGLVTLLAIWYLRLYADNGPFWQPAWLGALFRDLQFDSSRIEAPVGIVVLLVVLWWRGLRLGQDRIEHEQVARNFKIGFAALVAALLFIGTVNATARGALAVQLGLALPAFLFVGLASLSLARLAEIRRARSAQGTSQADPTRSWLVAMLVLSGAMVLLMFVIEHAFSYNILLEAISALQPLWDGIGTVLGWVALGIGYVLYWVFHPLAQLLRPVLGHGKEPNFFPSSPSRPKLPNRGNEGGLPEDWLAIGEWVLLGVGIVLLLIILIRALRQFAAWRRDNTADEERESLGAAGILGAQLRALLAGLAARFQRKPSAEESGDTLPAASVRALYRRLLRQAHAHGLGRRAPETPREFAQRLGPALATLPPGSPAVSGSPDPNLEALTEAYEQARYGNHEVSGEQVAALTADVDRLIQRLEQR